MAWGLAQRDFPVLTPGQMNPFNQAFPAAMQAYGDIQRNAYLPSQLQADILSKSAYATYAPYSYIIKGLTDPMILANMTPDQINKQVQSLANIPSNPLDAMRNNFRNNQPGPLSQLWHSIFGEGSQSPQAQTYNSVPQALAANPGAKQQLKQTGQYTLPGPSSVTPQLINATSNQPPTSSNYKGSSNGVDYSDPMMNANHKDYSEGGKYPARNVAMALKLHSAEKKAADEAALKGAGEGAKVDIDEMNKLSKEAATNSTSGFNLLLNATKFKDAYDKAWATGPLFDLPIFDKISTFDPKAVEAANYSNNAGVEMASKLFGNKISDYREKLGQQIKFQPKMPKEAVHDVFEGIQAESQRLEENSDFVDYAQNTLGINDPKKIRNAWFDYNRDVPFWDIKTQKPIPSTPGQYKDYLNNKLGNKYNNQNANTQININQQYSSEVGNQKTNLSGSALSLVKDFEKNGLPSFDSPQHYKAWFNRQPQLTKDAIREYLRRKESRGG
jgi:hypothetical protein